MLAILTIEAVKTPTISHQQLTFCQARKNMKSIIIRSLCLLLLSVCFNAWSNNNKAETLNVIRRFVKNENLKITLVLSLPKVDGRNQYAVSSQNGSLCIKGSSGVAACRGFYDFVKNNNLGISSWSGNRFEIPPVSGNFETLKKIAPFKHYYYMNVVTYGYSTPYWDWNRWEKEIDWMALHGIDMPLALVANEAISKRVWQKLGLTDSEIDNYFVGPAHLPWMRMGNISGIDAPIPNDWHLRQINLQHKILDRMRSLGMKPICPGFAGFVPKEIKRIFPDAELIETSWCDGAFHNWMLSPKSPLFIKIGKMFIQEWEKEFGKCDYYIVDSFNEMEIPFPPKNSKERYSLLADYGKMVYRSIREGNKDAVWVMQGWMFGYQRDIWDFNTLEALVSCVPDNKMLLLDMAVDYNKCFWKNQVNWEFYKGLFNKQWVYSVIPNMGGKSALTGILDFYANGVHEALESENRGNLVGYGMAPEGIENNEVIYELITDSGWSSSKINLDEWLEKYTLCRYGKVSKNTDAVWKGLRNSTYGSFTDHPRFNWQFKPGLARKGTVNINDDFYKGVDRLLMDSEQFGKSPLYIADAIELTVMAIGGKLERLTSQIDSAYSENDIDKAIRLENRFEHLMISADRLLCSHPNLRLEKWLDFARKCSDDVQIQNSYERNARRIVTIWGPPVDDYSARIWSGLLRDYYLPRWKKYFESKRNNTRFDISDWERRWVEEIRPLSPPNPFNDPLEACKTLLQESV